MVSLSSNLQSTYGTGLIIGLLFLHSIKFIFLVFLLSDIVIRFLSVRYYITKHHLIIGSGIVHNEEKTYELNQLKSVSVYQDWVGKRFNYGSIHLIFTAPSYTEEFSLTNVASPQKAAQELEKFLGEDQMPVSRSSR